MGVSQPPSPQPAQPAQYQYQPAPMPMGSPPRQRSGFLGGCLVGGCLVVVLEVAALFGAGIFLGAAVSRTVSNFSSSLQNILPSSEPCSPHPCLAHNGLELLVANLNRNAGPGAAAPSPSPVLHRVRFDVTFVAVSGDHDVSSVITIRDSTNSIRTAAAAPGCGAYPTGTLPAGQRLGPTPLCFDVAGRAADPLNLEWVPGESGSLAVLELKL